MLATLCASQRIHVPRRGHCSAQIGQNEQQSPDTAGFVRPVSSPTCHVYPPRTALAKRFRRKARVLPFRLASPEGNLGVRVAPVFRPRCDSFFLLRTPVCVLMLTQEREGIFFPFVIGRSRSRSRGLRRQGDNLWQHEDSRMHNRGATAASRRTMRFYFAHMFHTLTCGATGAHR